MTPATTLDIRPCAGEDRAIRTRRPALTSTCTVTLLDGGVSRGGLAGPVRHVLELQGGLTRPQRLALVAPAALPRPFTAAEAALLAEALVSAGAQVSISSGPSPR